MNSLSISDRKIVLKLLGENCKCLSMGLAQVWKWGTDMKTKQLYIEKYNGVLCLVRDCNKKELVYRLYCLRAKQLIWENKIHTNKYYKEKKPFLHTFPYEDHMIGFNFVDEFDAEHMKNSLFKHVEKLKQNEEDFEYFKKKIEVDKFFNQKGVLNSDFEEDGTRHFIYKKIHKLKESPIVQEDISSVSTNTEPPPSISRSISAVKDDFVRAKPEAVEVPQKFELLVDDANEQHFESFVICEEPKDVTKLAEIECQQFEQQISSTNPSVISRNGGLPPAVKPKPVVIRNEIKKIGKEDISSPSDFKIVSHVGYDHEKDEFVFPFTNIDSLIRTTSISVVHLKSIVDFIAKTGLDNFKEQVDAEMSTNKHINYMKTG